jgi:DNA mismatch repair protein MutL
MGKIKVLSQNLINKIAAGEVVERPASVVKELIENSLDAGADRVHITIEDGGRRLISISDNGCGMDKEDIQLAFASHATSKIASLDDLFAITTMGFRGEALASIGAVSRVTLTSRQKGALSAYQLHFAGGQEKEFKETGAPEGTTVTVEDLFFNVPARRKFLRSAASEASYITESVTRIAMATPSMHIQLIKDGRRALTLPPAATIRDRLAAIFGEDTASALLEAEETGENVKVLALVGSPLDNRADTKMQFVFVNNRPLRDRIILKAVSDSFAGLLPQKRFPLAFIFLSIDQRELDVNVHPAKIEVRFKNPGFVHSIVKATVGKALRTSRHHAPAEATESQDLLTRHERIKDAIESFLRRAEPKQRDFTHQFRSTKESQPSQALPVLEPLLIDRTEKFMQVHGTYIILETQTGILVIDQHALHERIIYEELKESYASKNVASQRLLFPELVDLAPKEMAVLQEVTPSLAIVGFELEEFADNSVVVRSAPTILHRADIPDAVRAVINNYVEETAPDVETYLESVMQTLACKAAVKAGQTLSKEEIEILLSDSRRLPAIHTCPHGRPIYFTIPVADIERQLKRR